MTGIGSAYVSGYPSNPVISGAAAVNEVLTAGSATAAAWQLGLVRQAATAPAGYALVNGTGNIITWTPPNDGLLHRVQMFGAMDVGSAMTGGVITISFTQPDGTVSTFNMWAAQAGTGFNFTLYQPLVVVKAGTAVTVAQQSALTGGAATLWAEIWGS